MSRPAPRGFALVAVLLTMALVAVLAMGAAFAAGVRARGVKAAVRSPVLVARAESVAIGELLAWDDAPGRLAIGQSRVDSGAPPLAAATIVRLTAGDYVIAASAADADQRGARAGVMLVVHRDSLAVGGLAALTVRGTLDLADRARVDGIDRPPTTWLECAPSTVVDDAIAAADPAGVRVTGAAAGLVRAAPEASDTLTYARAGGVPWDSLWAHAEVRLRPDSGAAVAPMPVVSSGLCAAGAMNWGEPVRRGGACEPYHPVIGVDGALVVGDGRGQGLMLVDGDLTMRGDASFAGLVIVRGRLSLADRARIDGAVLVLDRAGRGSVVADDAVIQRSACAVAEAVRAAGAPHPAWPRAWAPAY